MIKCKICGCEFPLIINDHYIARDNSKTGFAAALQANDEAKIYDAFDCPHCGCQVVAQERKRLYAVYEETTEEVEITMEGNEND